MCNIKFNIIRIEELYLLIVSIVQNNTNTMKFNVTKIGRYSQIKLWSLLNVSLKLSIIRYRLISIRYFFRLIFLKCNDLKLSNVYKKTCMVFLRIVWGRLCNTYIFADQFLSTLTIVCGFVHKGALFKYLL